MGKLNDMLSYLFFPPKCAGCGRLMQRDILDTSLSAFCETCFRKWSRDKLELCEKCGMELSRCRCMPQILRTAGADAALKLVSYSAKETVGKRAILYLKRFDDRRVVHFFSCELEGVLREYLDSTYTLEKSVLITYVPRSAKNHRRYGFDQSACLCRELAEMMGCETLGLLKRSHRSREQKKLGGEDRMKNAETQFRLAEADYAAIDRAYRVIVLVDDLMTTGASLAACTKLLGERFHGRIVCLTIARTSKEKGK